MSRCLLGEGKQKMLGWLFAQKASLTKPLTLGPPFPAGTNNIVTKIQRWVLRLSQRFLMYALCITHPCRLSNVKL